MRVCVCPNTCYERAPSLFPRIHGKDYFFFFQYYFTIQNESWNAFQILEQFYGETNSEIIWILGESPIIMEVTCSPMNCFSMEWLKIWRCWGLGPTRQFPPDSPPLCSSSTVQQTSLQMASFMSDSDEDSWVSWSVVLGYPDDSMCLSSEGRPLKLPSKSSLHISNCWVWGIASL